MSGDDPTNNPNRTVFRPSPLSGLGQRQQQPPAPGGFPPAPGGFGAPPPPPPPSGFDQPPPSFGAPPPPPPPPPPSDYSFAAGVAAPAAPRRLNDDDIPVPTTPRDTRSLLVTEAGPILALAASVRSGRARIAMPDLHREASTMIAEYDRAIASMYPDEVRQRARYALCATVDDIAQNLPNIGHDGAEWARRSLVVQFFRESIGGDRFWQLVDELLARPGQNAELIELFLACLAAGFEGRFRVMPDGKSRLAAIMSSLYGALDHPRALSQTVISPQWTGTDAPLRKVGLFDRLGLVAAAALAGLLVVYILLRVMLSVSGSDSWNAVQALTPDEPLRLSRAGTPPPAAPASTQLQRLREFLAPEIRQRLVAVEEDGSTVRVRTTVGQLFQSGSDQLEPGRRELFERIGRAVEGEPGQVTVEGHADSDKLAGGLMFPDNLALSQARAETVAGVIRDTLSNPGRISAKGFGDSRPIASNDNAEGKALNRRVEIVIPRQM